MGQRQPAKKLYSILLWAVVLTWMIWIFHMSAQTAAESNALSGQTIRTGAELMVPDFKELPSPQQDKLIVHWQNPARKTAHVLLFFGLGVLCFLAARQHAWPMLQRIAIAFGISCGYAVFDEIHQMFVAGRGPMVADVGLDAAGAIGGVLLAALICRGKPK